MAIDFKVAQDVINSVENSENPPANVSQLIKAVADKLGESQSTLQYYINKEKLTVKTKPRPKAVQKTRSVKTDSGKVAVVEVQDGKVLSCRAFPDKETAIGAAAGMVGHVREALESTGVFSDGKSYSLNVVDLG